jgi:hypothetical protein
MSSLTDGSISSLRFKKDVCPLSSEVDSSLIHNLHPVAFSFKLSSGVRQLGFIAEEVDEWMPIIVQKDEGGQPRNIDYNGLVSLLLAEIKQLKKRVEVLEEKTV